MLAGAVAHASHCPSHGCESGAFASERPQGLLEVGSVRPLRARFDDGVAPAVGRACLRSYKGWVLSELERRRLAAPSGMMSRGEIVAVYCEGLRAVVDSKPWADAFEATGLRGQRRLSSHLKSRLGWEVPPVVPSTLPSLSDFQAIFPRGAQIQFDELFELALSCSQLVRLVLPRRARLARAAVPA